MSNKKLASSNIPTVVYEDKPRNSLDVNFTNFKANLQPIITDMIVSKIPEIVSESSFDTSYEDSEENDDNQKKLKKSKKRMSQEKLLDVIDSPGNNFIHQSF